MRTSHDTRNIYIAIRIIVINIMEGDDDDDGMSGNNNAGQGLLDNKS